MKRLTISTLLTLFLVHVGFTQNSHNKWNIGASLGTSQYAGDVANTILNFNQKALENNFFGGVSLSRYLNNSFDLTLMGNLGAISYFGATNSFKQEVLNLGGALKFKFANGYMIEEKSPIRPYLMGGAGFDRYKTLGGAVGKTSIDGMLNVGAGINLMITDNLALFYQATYFYMFSDNRDALVEGDMNDGYLVHAIGLNINLGKAKDTDGDGVADKIDECAGTPAKVKVDEKGCPLDGDGDGIVDYKDKCPTVAGPANVGGCPDADKDGIADDEDQCPDVAGLASLKGCPDTDGDGIIDSKDKCPNIKGILTFEGCPDTDNDGIQDSEDLCPTVAGVKLFKGCPDADNDGIQDIDDQCPDKKGPASTKGCPDTDNDGVHDGIDRCPTIAGIQDNAGCPAVKADVTQLFQKALQGIQFETGKAVIKKSSNGILDAVVRVMTENPAYNLSISGHTDDQGDDAKNMTLSKDRADAVAKYLITNGVDPVRVTTFGFGETKPVDTNKTAAGRTRNRRVELQVEFKQ